MGNGHCMLKDQHGFSLVELIVTMAIFIVVVMISSDSFNLILKQSSRLMHSEESNIEGMIGLEQLRHDLQQAGFGIPYEFPATAPVYAEAANTPASTYNDAPSGIPRAFSSGNNLAGISDSGSETGNTYNVVDGTDYLVIRGSSVGRGNTPQRWTYINYSSDSPKPHVWPSAAENIKNNAWSIVLNRVFSNGTYTNRLVVDGAIADVTDKLYFATTYNPNFLGSNNFAPKSPNEVHFVYGIVDGDDLRMPFNRTDYFVSKPSKIGSMPSACAPKTGILYKTTINHGDGKLSYIPIVDCVADMQVIYGWDLKNGGVAGTDGLIDTYSNADGSGVLGEATGSEVTTALGDAASIRANLKVVKVYLLVQNGRKDPNYTSPSPIALGDVGELSLSRNYTLTSDMLNYRWRVQRIIVRPKNLTSNQ